MPRSKTAVRAVRAFAATVTLAIALVTVGLTAASDAPFSIEVRPIFLRLGVDVEVRIGSLHLHASWSALPSPEPSTQIDTCTF